MISKKMLRKNSLLYAVIDSGVAGRRFRRTIEGALRGGADIIQLRDKKGSFKRMLSEAWTMKAAAAKRRVPFIINDRVELALAVGADGLHIGQGDIDISLAMRLLPKNKIVGVSVGNLKQAKKAVEEGADYLGAGPVFHTPIKKKVRQRGIAILKAVKRLGVSFFAIGGVDPVNIRRLTKIGVKRIAVIRAINEVKDPCVATRRLKEEII
jgi:thiamine-phosphate diphosphorylase